MSTEFGFNEQFLTKDKQAWFPVMGEMHYSRYRDDLWEESLEKIKAGGVTIVSTYVIWIHHEEEEGQFDFSGCRNLNQFLTLCKKVGLYAFLRPGPWAHAEVRNGGFPDWLQEKEDKIRLRTDDPEYLSYVRRFWKQVSIQSGGMMLKDGGPVIGIQIENEYGHVGGLTGEAGEKHMRTLALMAQDLGFDAPLYTATGWGGAVTGGLLPVMGSYCEAPWDQSTNRLPANENYLFSNIRNDTQIASDHHIGTELTYDVNAFPYLTAELGGGLQVTQHRRPVAAAADIGAMSLAKLGSGVGMLGYYMYHGGSNPDGKLSTLQESRATGYLNDLPEKNYDFNAPIRQFGSISDTYKEIRLLALFLKDFGDDMATLPAHIERVVVTAEDTNTLRLSSRHNGNRGYVFFNNYQRQRTMAEHRNVQLIGPSRSGDIRFPHIDVRSGEYAFYPYKMKLDHAVLQCATATPLCRLRTREGNIYVFYGDQAPNFTWFGNTSADVLHISRSEALHATKVTLDQDYLILSDNFVWEDKGKLVVTGSADTIIKAFPELPDLPDSFAADGKVDGFWTYKSVRKLSATEVELKLKERDSETAVYEIAFDYGEEARSREEGRDSIVVLDFTAESVDVYCEGIKINDYFYTGQQAILSLGYFGFPLELTFVLHALHDSTEIYLEEWPEIDGGKICEIHSVSVREEFRN